MTLPILIRYQPVRLALRYNGNSTALCPIRGHQCPRLRGIEKEDLKGDWSCVATCNWRCVVEGPDPEIGTQHG